MSCTLSNKCGKNRSKRTVLLQLIIRNVVTCFFGTQCRYQCSVSRAGNQQASHGISSARSLQYYSTYSVLYRVVGRLGLTGAMVASLPATGTRDRTKY